MITEEWQIQIGRNKHIISGDEMKLILNSGEARFVQLNGLTVNPAFVSDMVLLRKINKNQLEAPKDDFVPISREKFQDIKRQALEKIKH
jgi:hypothetical protein